MTGTASRSAVRLLSRSAAVASVAFLVLCVPAGAQTVGYLYTAVGSSIDQFDVGADTGLTAGSSVAGGPATPEYPGSLVMAKTADGENLYQLARTGTTETIYQYSVNPSTGEMTAKSPATIGSIPLLASQERRFMAVFNPAADGHAGQNALYVLSGPNTKSADLYMFDIDATTGALTPAGEIPIPGIIFGEALAYSANKLAITGSTALNSEADQEGFQSAVIDQSSGVPVFSELVDLPCPGHSCDDGALYMLNSDEMLSFNLVFDPNTKVPETYVGGVSAYEVGGGWAELGSSASYRPGPGELTANGSDYFGTEGLALAPYEIEEGEYQPSEYGDSWVAEIAPDGSGQTTFELPPKSGVPVGIFALGSGLYVADENYQGSAFLTGNAFRLAPAQAPVSTELDSPLGTAMTGFLIGGSEGSEGTNPEKGTPGAPGSETPSGTPSPGPGTPSPTGAGGVLKPPVSGAPTVVPPPDTKIASVKLSGEKTTIRFTGSGGVGKLTFRCKLGNAKKTTLCHSPDVYSHLAPGKHRFSVAATDSRGIADPSPAVKTFNLKG